jgi:hypothetical protein
MPSPGAKRKRRKSDESGAGISFAVAEQRKVVDWDQTTINANAGISNSGQETHMKQIMEHFFAGSGSCSPGACRWTRRCSSRGCRAIRLE